MGTVTIMTSTSSDLKPDNQLPCFLLAAGEDYANLEKAFKFVDSEIQDIKSNGLE
jgi:hypothetical protein